MDLHLVGQNHIITIELSAMEPRLQNKTPYIHPQSRDLRCHTSCYRE